MGGYAPTLGIIGTVIGPDPRPRQPQQPRAARAPIAGAFVATLWGVLSANAIWLPMSNKLKRMSEFEVAQMEMVLEGVLAIQSGTNPRLVEQKLRSILPAVPRKGDAGVAAEAGLMAGRTSKLAHAEEEHENHERWLLTYADMITLLMVLFIVLFAIEQVDQKKFDKLHDGLANSFGEPTVLQGSAGVLEGSASQAPSPDTVVPGSQSIQDQLAGRAQVPAGHVRGVGRRRPRPSAGRRPRWTRCARGSPPR